MKVSIEYAKNGKDKVRVKIESHDLWSGDVTLARVIYPFLKKYRNLYNGKNSMCGYPLEFSSDPLKPEGPDNPDRFDEWLICLDKMVYAFGWIAKNKDWDGPWTKEYYRQYDILLKPYRKELKKLAQEDDKRFKEIGPSGARESLEFNRRLEILKPLFHEFNKHAEEHRKKLQEGIDLFAKYFGTLWT